MWILGKVIDMGGKIQTVGADIHIECDKVLEAAKGLKEVLVLGENAEGEWYFASSTGDIGTLLWLVEAFKHDLLSGDFDE